MAPGSSAPDELQWPSHPQAAHEATPHRCIKKSLETATNMPLASHMSFETSGVPRFRFEGRVQPDRPIRFPSVAPSSEYEPMTRMKLGLKFHKSGKALRETLVLGATFVDM